MFSDAMREQSTVLKRFLFKNLYRHPQVMETTGRAQQIVRDLFAAYVQAPQEMNPAFAQQASTSDGTAKARAIADFIAGKDWIANLAERPEIASCTSVCLKFTDPRITDGATFAKNVAKRLEKEGVALDAGAYRDAPPGLRIWCGATVETADVAALMPWIEFAFAAEIAALAKAA